MYIILYIFIRFFENIYSKAFSPKVNHPIRVAKANKTNEIDKNILPIKGILLKVRTIKSVDGIFPFFIGHFSNTTGKPSVPVCKKTSFMKPSFLYCASNA